MPRNDELLKPVLKRLHDSIKGYRDLARRTRHPTLLTFALNEAKVRRGFATELRAQMLNPEEEPMDGSMQGWVLRVLKDVRALFPGADAGMLQIVDQGEELSRERYGEALAGNPESAELRELLQRQQSHIHRAQARVRGLRDEIDGFKPASL